MKSYLLHIIFALTVLLFPGLCYSDIGKIDSLNRLLQQKNLSKEAYLDVISQLGYEYWTVNPAKSISLGRKALNIAIKTGNQPKVAFNYRVIGVAYWAMGDYQIALDNMLKSLDLYKGQKDSIGIGNMLMNIGLVYSEQLSYDRAKKFYQSAIPIFEDQGETGRKATTLTKLASILIEEDSLIKAAEYLLKAVDIHRQNGFKYGIAESYNRLGILYLKKGDLNASLDYLYRSRDISQEIADRDGISKCNIDIGRSFLKYGKYDEAEKHFQIGLHESSKVGSKKWQLAAYQGFYELAKATNQSNMALKYLEKYQLLHDSILNQQKVFAIVNLQEEYESKEQLRNLELSNQKILVLQKEARARKLLILWLISFFILFLGFIILVYRYQRYKRREAALLKEKELRLMALEKANKEIEYENSKLREIELKRELELKHRELTSYALNFVQKNEFINDLKKDLASADAGPNILVVKKKLQNVSRIDQDWEIFRKQFENLHEGFIQELKKLHPDLTQGEIRHCILIRMNMTIKECSSILGTSPESTKTSRYRLRKKMNLDEKSKLYDYLLNFG